MSFDYTKIPANIINLYLWDLAKGDVAGHAKVSNGVFGIDVDTYDFRPFFPISENAGADVEKPFVTYQSMPRLKYDTDHFLKKERMVYTVVAPMPYIMYICNFINENLGKNDDTAAAINDHVKDSAVIFDHVTCYSVDLPEETTKFNSVEPRYMAEIVVDFDYRRAD